jgi:hypothetical protein
MTRKPWSVLPACVCLLLGAGVAAQDQGPEKVYKLLRDDASAREELEIEEQATPAWRPGLKAGTVEVSISLGMLSLDKVLLAHDQMIYKYTTEFTYWGDVTLTGTAAFNPALRLGYQVKDWVALEAIGGLSFSEYTSSIVNRHSRKNEIDAPIDEAEPPLGEYDTEARSLITLQTGLNAVVYPLAWRGDGTGRWHPYLTAGAGRIWYDMNSNYTEGSVSSLDLNAGGGIRVLGDRNVSVRCEVLMHRNTLQWNPATDFLELNEGTTLVPLNEYPVQSDGSFDERPITSFNSLDMNSLSFSIGVQGTF